MFLAWGQPLQVHHTAGRPHNWLPPSGTAISGHLSWGPFLLTTLQDSLGLRSRTEHGYLSKTERRRHKGGPPIFICCTSRLKGLCPADVNLVLRGLCVESGVGGADNLWDRTMCHYSSPAWEGRLSLALKVCSVMTVATWAHPSLLGMLSCTSHWHW